MISVNSVYKQCSRIDLTIGEALSTYFFNVGSDERQIFNDWVTYLRQEKLWGNDDPLFPATLVELGEARQFEAVGRKRLAEAS